jgi:hypothetical protein
MHISRRKLDIKAVAGVPRESSGVSDSLTGHERCVSKVIAGRPNVSGYDKNPLNEVDPRLKCTTTVEDNQYDSGPVMTVVYNPTMIGFEFQELHWEPDE